MGRYRNGPAAFSALSSFFSAVSDFLEPESSQEDATALLACKKDLPIDLKPAPSAVVAFRPCVDSEDVVDQLTHVSVVPGLFLPSLFEAAESVLFAEGGSPPSSRECPEVAVHERRLATALASARSRLLRLTLRAWRVWQQQADAIRQETCEKLRCDVFRTQTLGLWLLGPEVDVPRLRAFICAWRQTALTAQAHRADLRSEQRAAFSPDAVQGFFSPKPPVLAPSPGSCPLTPFICPSTPAAMQRALVTFLTATMATLLHGCFLAWRGCGQQARRRSAGLMWLMERMALTQTGLVLQAAFRSWCHLAVQNRQPAWARALQHDMQLLNSASLGPSGNAESDWSSHTLLAPCRLRSLAAAPALICACSLFVHVLLFVYRSGIEVDRAHATYHPVRSGGDILWSDMDGDGLRDEDDRCPSTPAHYKFYSTWRLDWDGDGCLDSVEDTDDDGDLVPNLEDSCPGTVPSHNGVDLQGCSQLQRQPGGASGFLAKLLEIIVEVLLGALLTAALNFGWKPVSSMASRCRQRFVPGASAALEYVWSQVLNAVTRFANAYIQPDSEATQPISLSESLK